MTGTPRPYFRERCVEGHGLYLRTLRCESPGGTVRLRSASSGVSRKGLDCPEPQHAPDVIRPCESGRGAEGCADKSRSGGERGRRGVMSQVCTGARGEGALQKYRGHARKGTPARARVRAVHRAQVAQGAPEVSANARRALPLRQLCVCGCQYFFFAWQRGGLIINFRRVAACMRTAVQYVCMPHFPLAFCICLLGWVLLDSMFACQSDPPPRPLDTFSYVTFSCGALSALV